MQHLQRNPNEHVDVCVSVQFYQQYTGFVKTVVLLR